MNERIKELVLEAEHGNYGRMAFGEKLAELIVRECIKMVENEAAQYVEPVWAVELVNDMHEHFGVEE
jgi:hypothetical protein